MKTILSIVKYLLISIYALCGIMLVVFLVPKTGWKALNVATGSMTPAVPQGSLVIIHHVNPNTLKTGDVVTYINPYNTKETITHRIVGVGHEGKIIAFTTKGDANQTADKQILGGNVVGQVVWHAPHVGKVLAWGRQPIGLILLVIIPGLFIIVDEIRRMVKKLSSNSSKEPIKDPRVKHEDDKPPVPVAVVAPAPAVAKPARRARPRMDGIVKSVALVAFLVVIVTGATRASLTSTASLTGNTISVAVPTASDHILIQRVFIGGAAGDPVCPLLNSNASIIDSNGINSIIISNHCHITINNSTTVNVTNSSSQSSSTGDASKTGNTNGGDATSGNASNSNSTSTTINVDNGGTFNSGQWIQLYNPTAATVVLTGWTLHDNSSTVNTLPTRSLRSHHSLFIRASRFGGQFGNGLDGSGDHLVLSNKLGALVDSLSWGSDTTVFNPSLPMIPVGSVAQRLSETLDSNTAADWQVMAP